MKSAADTARRLATRVTRKLYWHDTYLFKLGSTFIDKGTDDKGFFVVLDETIFHPQGGGQPSDEGTINGVPVVSLFEEKSRPEGTEWDEGRIKHYLESRPEPEWAIGDSASLEIDKDRRLLYAALHTAGHICAGVMRANHGYSAQTGANHFPGEARVEFKLDGSSISDSDRLEVAVHRVVEEKRPISQAFEEAHSIYHAPGRDPKTRCITIKGLWQEPCSGTHLKDTGEAGMFSIRKVKSKSGKRGKVSVGYDATHLSLLDKTGLRAHQERVDSLKAKHSADSASLTGGGGSAEKKDKINKSGGHSFFLRKDVQIPLGSKECHRMPLSDGSEVAFFSTPDGEVKARLINDVGVPVIVFDENNIHVNMNSDPAQTRALSSFGKKKIDWKVTLVSQIKSLTTVFSGELLITEVKDPTLVSTPGKGQGGGAPPTPLDDSSLAFSR